MHHGNAWCGERCGCGRDDLCAPAERERREDEEREGTRADTSHCGYLLCCDQAIVENGSGVTWGATCTTIATMYRQELLHAPNPS